MFVQKRHDALWLASSNLHLASPCIFAVVSNRGLLAHVDSPEQNRDDELLMRYRRGDVAAFGALYERHRRVLFGYLLRVLGDRTRAEDVHQETWLQVVQLIDRYRAGSSFKTWLFTLARSRCMDRLRRERVRAVEVGFDPDAGDGAYSLVSDGAGPPAAQHQRELGEMLRQALGRLPEAQREVFLLRDEADLSLVEVATVLGVDYEAVKSRYRYALARLRTELTARGVLASEIDST